MRSIVLIIPYFGKLPNYFEVWKMTAFKNETVDFLFFTDIPDLAEEKNIKVVRMSFSDFRALVQAKFDFEIALKQPYKLCDYKPAYGYVLSEYIRDYDFWGHCDIDLLFGDIRQFVTDEILSANRKILEHGHLTLYHNDIETNMVFMRGSGYSDYDYKKVFTSDESLYFDEFLGTQFIFRKEQIPTYCNLDIFFQVDEWQKPFQDPFAQKYNAVFYYEGGHLFALRHREDQILREEILYAHFLKRHIDYSRFHAGEAFYIVPNRLLPASVPLSKKLFRCKGKRIYRLKKKWAHVKTYWKRYRQGNYESFRAYVKSRKQFGAELRAAKQEIGEKQKCEQESQ